MGFSVFVKGVAGAITRARHSGFGKLTEAKTRLKAKMGEVKDSVSQRATKAEARIHRNVVYRVTQIYGSGIIVWVAIAGATTWCYSYKPKPEIEVNDFNEVNEVDIRSQADKDRDQKIAFLQVMYENNTKRIALMEEAIKEMCEEKKKKE